MKVVIASSSYVSKPLISLLSSSREHELIGLITNPDKATGRGMNIVPNELASWGMSNGINVLKPEGRDKLKDLIKTLCISNDESVVYSGGSDGTLRIWDVGQQRVI